MDKIKLDAILTSHSMWLENSTKGKRANLSGAYLSGANLSKANLSEANLSKANLSEANLSEANLSEANLSEANLHRADLSKANLSEVNLSEANLSRANLHRANLSGADLSGADLSGANFYKVNFSKALNIPKITSNIIVPEGDLIVYKKCNEGVVKLLIPKEAKRSNATTRKCRAEFAFVIGLPIGVVQATSLYKESFVYRLNEKVICDNWNNNRWEECGGGIHFFITKQEAEDYIV